MVRGLAVLLGLASLALAACVEEPTRPREARESQETAAAAGPFRVTIRDLGTLPGGTFSIALGINRFGHVMGLSGVAGGGETDAFIWSPERGMRDLGPAYGIFTGDINDLDRVAGSLPFEATESAHPAL